jgi:microcystin-dependent protein
MADPYLGEIRVFGFSFAPRGWAYCDGQIMSIAQSSALFSILGTTFGGNGQTTFGLPNMQGIASMHWGSGPGLTPRDLGESLGSVSVTLAQSQLPSHTHAFIGATTTDAAQRTPTPTAQAQLGTGNPGQVYSNTGSPAIAFSPKAIGPAGQSQPHDNLQPLLTMNFCIAMEGIFPSRN